MAIHVGGLATICSSLDLQYCALHLNKQLMLISLNETDKYASATCASQCKATDVAGVMHTSHLLQDTGQYCAHLHTPCEYMSYNRVSVINNGRLKSETTAAVAELIC